MRNPDPRTLSDVSNNLERLTRKAEQTHERLLAIIAKNNAEIERLNAPDPDYKEGEAS